jgi:hypothetical protein
VGVGAFRAGIGDDSSHPMAPRVDLRQPRLGSAYEDTGYQLAMIVRARTYSRRD